MIHGFIVAPIYYGGRAFICITLPDRGLPAVILNLVRDDLRMMALKQVAARAGGMKDIEECIGYFMRLSSKGLPKSVRQRQRSCLFGRDLRSLWQTDFATPGHWIPGQAVHADLRG